MTETSIHSDRPLEGKRIVITRAPEQSVELKARLEQLGAIVLSLPVVGFSAAADAAPLDQAILSIADFDWILFTSANAVRFFCERWRIVTPNLESQPKVRCSFAAVGPATAQALSDAHLAVNMVAPEYRGVALARKLAPILQGKKILLPRSDRARQDLPEALREAGADVTDVISYHTGAGSPSQQVLDAVKKAAVDVVAFFSPSAVENLREMLGPENFARIGTVAAMAAVGPVTAVAIRDAGLPVAIEAREATANSVVAGIEKHFTMREASSARSV
jgi:uroporphyrinogen III methyltransferase/synthase